MMAMWKLSGIRLAYERTPSSDELAWQLTGQSGMPWELTAMRSPAGAGAEQSIRVARRSAAASAEARGADAAGIAAGMLCPLCFELQAALCVDSHFVHSVPNAHQGRADGETSQLALG